MRRFYALYVKRYLSSLLALLFLLLFWWVYLLIALAIRISFGLFSDGAMMAGSGNMSGALGAILTIVEYCLPMITACACVKGAEATIRRCLGLG